MAMINTMRNTLYLDANATNPAHARQQRMSIPARMRLVRYGMIMTNAMSPRQVRKKISRSRTFVRFRKGRIMPTLFGGEDF